MKEMIQMTICTGTACYVMGAGDLLNLAEKLSAEEMEKLQIKGSPCLGFCKSEGRGRPPFIFLDGELVSEATMDKVLPLIRAKLV